MTPKNYLKLVDGRDMVGWESSDSECGYGRSGPDEKECTRSAMAGQEHCPYHTPPDERGDLDLVADMQSRLEALANGEVSRTEEPLDFRDVEMSGIELADLDFSAFKHTGLTLNLRGSEIAGTVEIEDVQGGPIELALRDADIGGLEIGNGEFRRIDLSDATVRAVGDGITAAKVHGTTVRSNVDASDGVFQGRVEMFAVERGGIDLDQATVSGGSLGISREDTGEISLRNATIEDGPVTVLVRDVGEIDATGVECGEFEVSRHIRSGDGDASASGPSIRLDGSTVSGCLRVDNIRLERLEAEGFRAADIAIEGARFSADEGDEPSVSLSDAEIDTIDVSNTDVPGTIEYDGVEITERMEVGERCELGVLRVADGTLSELNVAGTIDRVGIEDCTLSELEVAGTGDYVGVRDCSITDLTFAGTATNVLITRSAISETTTFEESICHSVALVRTEFASLTMNGAFEHVWFFETDVSRDARFRIPLEGGNEGSSDGGFGGTGVPSRSNGLPLLYVDEGSFRKVSGTLEAPNRDVRLVQTRVEERLQLDAADLGALEIDDSSVTGVVLNGEFGSVGLRRSEVAGDFAFRGCAVEDDLRIDTSQVARFDLTTESPLPVAETLELVDADLEGATLAAVDASEDVSTGDLSVERTNLESADLQNLSAGGEIDLADTDLTGAQLQGATLVDADLSNVLLSRANLTDADLRRADLSGTVFGDAQTSNGTLFGRHDGQRIRYDPEVTDLAETDFESKHQQARQAESIYKRLEALGRSNGRSDFARQMYRYRKDMTLYRRGEDRGAIHRLRRGSKRVWYTFTDYGIGPKRVSAFAVLFVVAFAIIYLLPYGASEVSVGLARESLLFSVGVFFNLAPGFFEPREWAQYAVAIESMFGAITLAVAIYTIGQRSSF